jgi:nitroreductase
MLAPTAANRQSFKVFVIKTQGHEDELKKVYGRDWFVKAPLVLSVCAIPGKCWTRVDGKNYSDVDAAIVMDHIILAATDLGLGTCWIGAFNPEAARQVLGLDDTYEPVAFTPLGYSEKTAFNKTRKQIDEIVVFK